MILSLNDQAVLFLLTVCTGAVIGSLYDVIRIFRKMISHKGFFIQIEDACYWVVVVFVMFITMMKNNNGEIRFFSLCGAFLGMGLYFLIMSPLVNKVSDRVVFVLHYIINLFITIILTPFRLLFLVLKKPVKKGCNFAKKKKRKALQYCKIYAKINRNTIARNFKILIRKK